jgi:plastocyanin
MPAFRAEHSDEDTWKLVSFVRRVPTLTPQDLERHADHAAANQIVMDGTTFAPNDVTVKVGDTVTWINKDPFPHDVYSSAGDFRSGALDPDRQWQLRATRPGRFPYVCTLHPGMNGTLIVNP